MFLLSNLGGNLGIRYEDLEKRFIVREGKLIDNVCAVETLIPVNEWIEAMMMIINSKPRERSRSS